MTDPEHDLTAQLSKCNLSQWRTGPSRQHTQGPNVEWIEVAALYPSPHGPILEIGLTKEGHWVVAAADGSVHDLTETSEYLPLFPLLERSFEDVRNTLETEFARRGLDEGMLASFPFELVVESALKSTLTAWPDLALTWVDRLPVSDSLLQALIYLEANGRTQSQRHGARRLRSACRSRLKAP